MIEIGQSPEKAPETIGDLLPHASGLAMAEVLSVESFKDLGGYGWIKLSLKTSHASGFVRDEIVGSMDSAFTPLIPISQMTTGTPAPVIDPSEVSVGQKFWIAFWPPSGQKYFRTLDKPHRSFKVWPRFDDQISKLCEKAIATDAFQWQPQFDPELGLSHGRFIDENSLAFIRVSKDQKVLWSKRLDNFETKRFSRYGFEQYVPIGPESTSLSKEKLFYVSRNIILPPDNEFNANAGNYDLTYWYDAMTGLKRVTNLGSFLTIEYSPNQKPAFERRRVNIQSKQIRRETSYDADGNVIAVQDFERPDGFLGEWIKIEN